MNREYQCEGFANWDRSSYVFTEEGGDDIILGGLVGWNKEGEEILLIVFMAVVSPVASTVTQMCQVYDNDSRYASAISVLTTLGAIVTMPLMVLLYQMVM